ncbi:MAG: hypothetical protein IIY88_05040 [Eubacterium sp.]|nr:hypothetical protein [Eubacterium sp.]
MDRNLLREKLAKKEIPIGTVFQMGSVSAMECLGYVGLDYVMIDCEHGQFDLTERYARVKAAKRVGISPVIRIAGITESEIAHADRCGADGIVIPCIRTMDEIKELLRMAGGTDMLILPQCETVDCLKMIERVVKVPGIDGIVIGPFDLTLDMGIPGQFDHPFFLDAIKRIRLAGKDAGVPVIIFGPSPQDARRYIDQGFDGIITGVDATVFTNAYKEHIDAIKETTRVPKGAAIICDALTAAGYEACLVGGCVRDSLLGLEPDDWDICTSALPEETEAVFADRKVAETGLKHGTVGVIMDDGMYEVTTYRIDGMYSDGRHPDSVTFSRNLTEDLARRDFTVNAMAMKIDTGKMLSSKEGYIDCKTEIVDPFSGRFDLRNGVIRCVGAPELRFSEDALRILRALRFASTLGFRIENGTERAVVRYAYSVGSVAAERVQVELTKLVTGKNAPAILRKYSSVLSDMTGSSVDPKAGDKIAALPQGVNASLAARLAMVFPIDTMASLKSLKYDNKTLMGAASAVEMKDAGIANDIYGENLTVGVKRLMDKYGAETVKDMAVITGRFDIYGEINRILKSGECFNRSGLKVTGDMLARAGIPSGRQMGELIDVLLDKVITGEIPNETQALLRTAMMWYNK